MRSKVHCGAGPRLSSWVMTYQQLQHHAAALARLHHERLDPFAERLRYHLPPPTERRLRQAAYVGNRAQIRAGVGPRFFGVAK